MPGNHSWHPFLLGKKNSPGLADEFMAIFLKVTAVQMNDSCRLWTLLPTEPHTGWVGLMLTSFISQIGCPGHPGQSPQELVRATELQATPQIGWTSNCLVTGFSGDQHANSGLKSCALKPTGWFY